MASQPSNISRAEDYYSDGESEGMSSGNQDNEMEEQGGETALLPSSLCPGMEPGDKLVLRIVASRGDQYEVAYESEEGESEQPSQAEMPSGSQEPSDMNELMA